MNTNVGLWIDHEKAVIIFITGKDEKTVIVESNFKNHFKEPVNKSDERHNERRKSKQDDTMERVSTEHLGIYNDKVIANLNGTESVLIFGPGEAKTELVKRIKNNNPAMQILAVEAVDRMTEPQVVAKVREYFL